jgi:hypothetical protein
MAQPPYGLPEDTPMNRFALFVAALLIIVAIGSQPRHSSRASTSVCVCLPSRAGLLLKSALVKTKARSAELLAAAQ